MYISYIILKQTIMTTTMTINEKINLRGNLIPYYSISYGNSIKAAINVNKLILKGISFK